jgi:hypothetical protein
MNYCTDWHGKGYAFMSNTACEYFPCHEIADASDFNCIFCFCPLYGCEDCGGSFSYVGKRKDCSDCVIPHRKDSYGLIMDRLNKF